MDLPSVVASIFKALPTAFTGSVTFTRVTLGLFQPTTGIRGGDNTTSCTTIGTMGPPRRSYGDTFEADATVVQRYRVIYAQAQGMTFAPDVKDTCVMGGLNWTIRAVLPVIPDGTNPALYECYVEVT